MIPFQSSSLLNGSVGTDSSFRTTTGRNLGRRAWGDKQIDQLRPIERGPREEKFRKGETQLCSGKHFYIHRRRATVAHGARRLRLRCWRPHWLSAHAAPVPHRHEPRRDAAGPVDRQSRLPRQPDPCPALIGVSKGFFQGAMPKGTTVKTTTFSAGPVRARRSSWRARRRFCRTGPAINAFIKTKGKVLIVAGAASGGAGLVVKQIHR